MSQPPEIVRLMPLSPALRKFEVWMEALQEKLLLGLAHLNEGLKLLYTWQVTDWNHFANEESPLLEEILEELDVHLQFEPWETRSETEIERPLTILESLEDLAFQLRFIVENG